MGVRHLQNSKIFLEKPNLKNLLSIQRCLSTKNNNSKNKKNLDVHADLYKPSTGKEEQHVPDDLKGGQPPETFDINPMGPTSAGGKVW